MTVMKTTSIDINIIIKNVMLSDYPQNLLLMSTVIITDPVIFDVD